MAEGNFPGIYLRSFKITNINSVSFHGVDDVKWIIYQRGNELLTILRVFLYDEITRNCEIRMELETTTGKLVSNIDKTANGVEAHVLTVIGP